MSDIRSLSEISAKEIITTLPKNELSKQSHNIALYFYKLYDEIECYELSTYYDSIVTRLEFLILLYKEFPYNEDKNIFSPFISTINRDIPSLNELRYEYNPNDNYMKEYISINDYIYDKLNFGFNEKDSQQLMEFIKKYEDKGYSRYLHLISVKKYSIIHIYTSDNDPHYNIFNIFDSNEIIILDQEHKGKIIIIT